MALKRHARMTSVLFFFACRNENSVARNPFPSMLLLPQCFSGQDILGDRGEKAPREILASEVLERLSCEAAVSEAGQQPSQAHLV